MSQRPHVWCGVDVRGHRKGFHLAAVDAGGLLDAPKAGFRVVDAVEWLARFSPAMAAVDSPICPAPPGFLSRAGERRVPTEVGCMIRATPDLATIQARTDDFYGWITHGLVLYQALRQAGITAIEQLLAAKRKSEVLPDVSAVLLHLDAAVEACLLYTSPSPRDGLLSRMPSSA